jgi:hypothetical protein
MFSFTREQKFYKESFEKLLTIEEIKDIRVLAKHIMDFFESLKKARSFYQRDFTLIQVFRKHFFFLRNHLSINCFNNEENQSLEEAQRILDEEFPKIERTTFAGKKIILHKGSMPADSNSNDKTVSIGQPMAVQEHFVDLEVGPRNKDAKDEKSVPKQYFLARRFEAKPNSEPDNKQDANLSDYELNKFLQPITQQSNHLGTNNPEELFTLSVLHHPDFYEPFYSTINEINQYQEKTKQCGDAMICACFAVGCVSCAGAGFSCYHGVTSPCCTVDTLTLLAVPPGMVCGQILGGEACRDSRMDNGNQCAAQDYSKYCFPESFILEKNKALQKLMEDAKKIVEVGLLPPDEPERVMENADNKEQDAYDSRKKEREPKEMSRDIKQNPSSVAPQTSFFPAAASTATPIAVATSIAVPTSIAEKRPEGENADSNRACHNPCLLM